MKRADTLLLLAGFSLVTVGTACEQRADTQSGFDSRAAVLIEASKGSDEPDAPQQECDAETCPNIVVIVADDLGWGDVGYQGSWIQTPHIDRLAATGIRMDRSYMTPICDPSRVAIMTGRSGIHTGTQYTLGPLDPDEMTLGERFGSAGYQTAIIGKWSLSPVGEASAPGHPNLQGFDHFYGHLSQAIDYFTHRTPFGRDDWWLDQDEIQQAGYATTLLGLDAVRYIQERDPDRPFLLALMFGAPHFPLQVPSGALERYRVRNICGPFGCFSRCELEGEERCTYARMLEIMDAWIGQLLDTLDAEGIAEDTIVVFASDNGGDPGFGGANAPLRGTKGTLFEGGIRVPTVISWPGQLPAGSVSTQFMHGEDLFPTLEAAAGLGVQAPPHDALNLWPILTGAPEVDRELFFAVDILGAGRVAEYGVVHHAIIDGSWKLVARDVEDGAGALTRVFHLFDIVADPEETLDRADEFPAYVEQLNERIERWADQYPADGLRSALYTELAG